MPKTRSKTQAEHATNTRSAASVNVAPDANRADKYKECERMVQMLKIVDLKKILSFLNIAAAGRKIDLKTKILSLLDSNFDALSKKINEVYSLSVAEQTAAQMAPGGGMPEDADAQNANVLAFTYSSPTQIPIHPDVRLKKLAFYEILGTLIKPSSLVPSNSQRLQEVPFYFTLTPQQAIEIATKDDIQVQLRCCLLEISCEQEDCFPNNLTVMVNNNICQLPDVIPTNQPNEKPKHAPLNVTSNVKLSSTESNTITVQWYPDYTRSFCVAVYLVKKLTSAQLLQRMKTKGVKPADYTLALIKEKLAEDADSEITTTMLKVSLNCPLGKLKMSLPCRASTCSHLQCFDAILFIQMNERKPTWNCPVCDKPAIYEHLIIDGYFQQVLKSALLRSDDTEIQLHKDGSWSTTKEHTESQFLDTPPKPIQIIEVISDDIELITTDVMSPNANEEPAPTTIIEIVDLTLSDSDDDLPLAKLRELKPEKCATEKNN